MPNDIFKINNGVVINGPVTQSGLTIDNAGNLNANGILSASILSANTITASIISDGTGNTITNLSAGSIIEDNQGDFLSFGYFGGDPTESFPGFVQLSDNAQGQVTIYQGALSLIASGVDALDITELNATFNIPVQFATAITTSNLAVNSIYSAGSDINFPAGINFIGLDGQMPSNLTNTTITVCGSPVGHGTSGDCGLNISNYSTSSLNSGTSYNINVHSSSGVVLSTNSVTWTHVPPNRVPALLPGWTYIVLNKDPVNVKGYGMCAPGISGYDSGNYSMFLCDMVNNLYRIPYWVPGVYQPGDIALNLTVASMSNSPVAGDKYTSGSITYSVNSSNVAGAPGVALGTINFASASAPNAPGILTRTSGAGDLHISYSGVNVFSWRDSLSISSKSGNALFMGTSSFNTDVSISGSLIGTRISCSAITASTYVGLPYRAGQQAIGNLSTSQIITFSSALPTASYAVSIGSDTTLATAVSIASTGKTISGFTASLSAGISGGANLDYIAWLNN